MKITYDSRTDSLTIIFSDHPIVKSDELIAYNVSKGKNITLKRGDRFEIQEINGRLVLVPLPEKPLVRLSGTLKGETSLTRSLQKEHT